MRKNHQGVLFAAILCFCTLAAFGAWFAFQNGVFSPGKPTVQRVPLPSGLFGQRNLRESQGWVPQDFFKTPAAIRACEAIANRNPAALQDLIDAGLDVNQADETGMTLLYWAFACENLEAFELLLDSGADPDKKLKRSIYLHDISPFVQGDSILFTCMRQAWEPGHSDFFFAALKHTREIDQRDWHGDTLLLLAVNPLRSNLTGKAVLTQIIRRGVDLDAQNQYGSTAAMLAVNDNRPQAALQIFVAGADPNIRNHRSETVADWARRKLKFEKNNPSYPHADLTKLLEWLEEHSPPDEE